MISENKRNGSGYYDPTAYMAMMNVRKEGENKMEVYRGDADKIVVLKDGVVAESGTPEELKKKDGIYANMMKTQLMAADWSL